MDLQSFKLPTAPSARKDMQTPQDAGIVALGIRVSQNVNYFEPEFPPSPNEHKNYYSFYANATSLSTSFYQTLLDRCWRRSGKLIYRPDQRRSCCPHYTIRLDSRQCKPSRDQRQAVNRFNKFVLGDHYIKEAARLYPKTREDIRKRDNEFSLVDRVHEAEYMKLKAPPEPAHKLVITLEEDNFTEEKYQVYNNYQTLVHKDPPEDRTPCAFKRFLCSSPLRRETMVTADGRRRRLGSYHQCYRLDGVLVAIGVLDLLPTCVSSVYFLYHESFHKYSPGKLGALQEIALASEEGYLWWYPGFYIHNCPKMRYKIDFSPQYILDPHSLGWDRLDSTVLRLLDQKSFLSLSIEQKIISATGARGGSEDEERDAKRPKVNNIDDEGGCDVAEFGNDEEDEEDDEGIGSLFQSRMPGIKTVSEMMRVDLDHVAIKVYPVGPLFKTSDLVAWASKRITDWPSIKASVAELIAAIGPDMVDARLHLYYQGDDQIFDADAQAFRKLLDPNHEAQLFTQALHPSSSPKLFTQAQPVRFIDAAHILRSIHLKVMATQQTLLSPAELAYLHSSLSLTPPIRPDGRTPTQFRPLTAETGILPGTNGSARVCFSDGTEAIVGVKAEIEKTPGEHDAEDAEGKLGPISNSGGHSEKESRGDWLEMAIEIPGQRDDEASTVFLAEMLSEALLADGEFAKKLWINRRFHWRLYLDVLLISPPLSYPLPLLSLTLHLALLATRLPRLKSEGDEDPMFDDDWESSQYLYPREGASIETRPSITLLVIAVGDNIIFDPSKEELAVAQTALAVSVSEVRKQGESGGMDLDSKRELRVLSMRTVDPPSRLTPPGVPNAENVATNGASAGLTTKQPATDGHQSVEGVWRAPLGGTKYAVLEGIMEAVIADGGVVGEMLDGLEGVDFA
ncbi:Exosome complex component rrp42 [Conoideocrella luteorostrata]|uniref:arginyltransferase n=1 Tax=Conoideocrella luteorostrata TaxID=1105319 RepID=A0AAJ0CGA9_9HYPO|nr:Exosome complex component rrp42 [Conoideocrella luteorostrata]